MSVKLRAKSVSQATTSITEQNLYLDVSIHTCSSIVTLQFIINTYKIYMISMLLVEKNNKEQIIHEV